MIFNKDGAYEVELMGCIIARDGKLLADECMDKFIAFVEENSWYFGGGSRQIIDGYYVDGNLNPLGPLKTIKEVG